MRHFIHTRQLILLALLLLADYTLSPLFSFLKGRVELLDLLILDYAFFWRWERVPFFGLWIGLVRDFLVGHLFGIETLSLTVSGLLLHLGAQKLEREIFSIRLGMSFLFVFISSLLSVILGTGIEASRGLSWDLIGYTLRTSIYTTALVPAFFWMTDRWFGRSLFLKQYRLFR